MCIPATQSAEWDSLTATTVTGKMRQYVALGLHPCFLSQHQEADIDRLDELLGQPIQHIVAVGETGLDFYDTHLTDNQRSLQYSLFTQQVQLAKKHQLPLIIHARKSHDQVLKALRQYKPEAGGIIHAYSGSEQQAKQYIQLGFKLGVGGVITYPRAAKTRHLSATLPINSIVLETDAPDMPLHGFQGLRNSPEQLLPIAECLAKLRNIEVKEVAEHTTVNCQKLFSREDEF